MLPKILEIEQNFSLIDGSNSVYLKFPSVYKIFTDSWCSCWQVTDETDFIRFMQKKFILEKKDARDKCSK